MADETETVAVLIGPFEGDRVLPPRSRRWANFADGRWRVGVGIVMFLGWFGFSTTYFARSPFI